VATTPYLTEVNGALAAKITAKTAKPGTIFPTTTPAPEVPRERLKNERVTNV